MPLSPGVRISVYEVLSTIGAGGMGEVYRARDTRLNRDVALKVLPAIFAVDRDRLARFEREARTLAALNHPNIAQIYGVVDSPADAGAPSIPALVMEFVAGEDLADRVARGPLPAGEAIRIATQIAEALDAAHERGIVHRDLKPANIRLTPDGSVKVLDFGVAKALDLVSGTSETVTSHHVTQDGVIVGTASYMSPEQARGLPVDRRTDIWAFGCVLYEMLTGQRAFRGETTSDISAAILTAEPDWSALPAATPANVRRVLTRLLQKDPKRRARDIADVRFALEEAGVDPTIEASAPPRRMPRVWQTLAVVSTVLAIALGAMLLFARRPSLDVAPAVGSRALVTVLTGNGGFASNPALAPDGGSFVYVSDDRGQPDIFRRQIEGGDPVPLTQDAATEADLVFAPNGEWVYFTRQDAGPSAIWRVGALGGNARKVVDNARAPAVSRDGRHLAYLTATSPGYALVVAAADGANPRVLVRDLRFQFPVRPSWSPDGRLLAYSVGALFQPRNLFVVNVEDASVRQVTRYERGSEGPTAQSWLPDGRRLLVSYWAQPRAQLAGSDLGILDVESGQITRLTMNTEENFNAPSLSLDGTRAIATASLDEREVWTVPDGPDPIANGRRAERLLDAIVDPFWTYVSRDGRTLLYNNAVVGSRNLWVMPIDRSRPVRQITSVTGDRVTHSSLSPDATRVAMVSMANGTADIWLQNVDGSGLRQLTNDPAADAWPVWSPDGRSIMYAADQQTMIVSADGGEPRKLIDGFFRGDWITRPDGQGTWAVSAVVASGTGRAGIRLIDVEGRVELWREPAPRFAHPMFNHDGSAISVAFEDANGQVGIAVYDTPTRKRRIAVLFPQPFQFYFRASWIDNDRGFAVNRYRLRSRVVMIDGLLPKP